MALISNSDVEPTPKEVQLPNEDPMVVEGEVVEEPQVESKSTEQTQEVVETPPAADKVEEVVEQVESEQSEETHMPATPAAQNKDVSISGGQSTMGQEMSDAGFEGFSLGFGAFPYLSLQVDGDFLVI